MPVPLSSCADCGAPQPGAELVCDECRTQENVGFTQPRPLPTEVQSALASSYLTAADFALLQSCLEQSPGSDAFTSLLVKRKLASARVVLPSDVPADVATINSRVVFRLDGGATETRVLVHWDHDLAQGLTLPVTTPLGIALLGMTGGKDVAVLLRGGRTRHLSLVRVAYQPERARRLNGTL